MKNLKLISLILFGLFYFSQSKAVNIDTLSVIEFQWAKTKNSKPCPSPFWREFKTVLMRVSCERLESTSGAFYEFFGSVLGAHWELHGVPLGHLGNSLRGPWEFLGSAFGAPLRHIWSSLGAPWECLGSFWEHVERTFGVQYLNVSNRSTGHSYFFHSFRPRKSI